MEIAADAITIDIWLGESGEEEVCAGIVNGHGERIVGALGGVDHFDARPLEAAGIFGTITIVKQ